MGQDLTQQKDLIFSNLKLLIDLYQFLPGKKNAAASQSSGAFNMPEGRRGRNQSDGRLFNTIQAGSTPLDALQREAIELRNDRKRTPGAFESDINDPQKALLKGKLNQLAQRIVDKFGKVSSAFRAFDIRTRGAVTFSDFAYVVDQLKLNFERDLILQIFTYMDTDQDNMLKYRDFCNLCAEQVLQAP